jgi:hypothetical protein
MVLVAWLAFLAKLVAGAGAKAIAGGAAKGAIAATISSPAAAAVTKVAPAAVTAQGPGIGSQLLSGAKTGLEFVNKNLEKVQGNPIGAQLLASGGSQTGDKVPLPPLPQAPPTGGVDQSLLGLSHAGPRIVEPFRLRRRV